MSFACSCRLNLVPFLVIFVSQCRIVVLDCSAESLSLFSNVFEKVMFVIGVCASIKFIYIYIHLHKYILYKNKLLQLGA